MRNVIYASVAATLIYFRDNKKFKANPNMVTVFVHRWLCNNQTMHYLDRRISKKVSGFLKNEKILAFLLYTEMYFTMNAFHSYLNLALLETVTYFGVDTSRMWSIGSVKYCANILMETIAEISTTTTIVHWSNNGDDYRAHTLANTLRTILQNNYFYFIINPIGMMLKNNIDCFNPVIATVGVTAIKMVYACINQNYNLLALVSSAMIYGVVLESMRGICTNTFCICLSEAVTLTVFSIIILPTLNSALETINKTVDDKSQEV